MLLVEEQLLLHGKAAEVLTHETLVSTGPKNTKGLI